MTNVYDLVVIGAGPAGQGAAELAARLGRRVLIIERNLPGGVVTTTGGAPTKALREAATYLTGFRQEEVYGVRSAVPLAVALPIIRKRVTQVRDRMQAVVAQQLASLGVAYLRGTARLSADGTVQVTAADGSRRRLETGATVIATGSRPAHAPHIPFDDPDVHDTDQIYSIGAVPEDIAIVGTGPVGVEFATVFTALGIPVTLIGQAGHLLPGIDAEMAGLLADDLTQRGSGSSSMSR